jgi:ATP-dependent DNA ligase
VDCRPARLTGGRPSRSSTAGELPSPSKPDASPCEPAAATTSPTPFRASRPLAKCGQELLLDGELVAGAGRDCDFYSLAPRLAGRPRRPGASVSFWAFDLLWLDGTLLIDQPYAERRAAMEELLVAGPFGIVPCFSGPDALELLAVCADHDVEGIVLKWLTSRYSPGLRSRHWRKVKAPGWAAIHAQRRRPQ